jgi:Nucleotidyl transferase AbiEii toxin, Type IV TA system
LFDRPFHQRIARVLEALDAPLLLKHRCLFGGGTAIALSHGEYRESVDVDFICSSIDGYRELRSLVSRAGADALLRTPLALLREPRIDQYGIRWAFAVDATPVKFEIVFEGRVALADPGPADRIEGVWTLTRDDMVTTKLMANSDRWADDVVHSRDLIDLAMLADDGILPAAAFAKAKRAYGESVVTDLAKAKAHLLDREGRMRHCMRALGVRLAEDELRVRIERLRFDKAGIARTAPKRGRQVPQ